MNANTTPALWTIAYRKPTANRFERVTDFAGTWDEAVEMAQLAVQLRSDLQIWYVPTAEAEAAGYSCDEDRGNILVESGKRIRITDTGTLAVF